MNERHPTAPLPPEVRTRVRGSKPVLLGALASVAVLAGWSLLRTRQRTRRYADHAQERRSPLSLFIGGDHPRRRRIDQSGSHPLFERRQSVYETY